MVRIRTVLGAVIASTFVRRFGGVACSILPNPGTVIRVFQLVVGPVLGAIASGVPASRDRRAGVVTPPERTILFWCRL